MFAKIYRRFVPAPARKAVYNLFLGSLLRILRLKRKRKLAIRLRAEISSYYESEENRGVYPVEYYSAAQWIKKNGYNLIPYDYISEYERLSVEVFKCRETGLKYVIHNKRRIYFPKSFSSKACRSCYRDLLIEQDTRSPHRYCHDCFDGTLPWTVFDIGAAEGIFTLNIIDKIEKAYLFEYDQQWLRALRATFKPYSDKVEIVDKYVSDEDTDTTISLDTFMKNRLLTNGYIKMDIEGAESAALKGAESLLKTSGIRFVAACTYHANDAGKEISDCLERFDYSCLYTPGVMAIGNEPPYFRQGVLYATKLFPVKFPIF